MSLLFTRVTKFRSVQMKGNADITFLVLSKSSIRILAKGLHSSKKCFSSSTLLGQKGQNRAFLSIFRCLPFSIISGWFESLSFVNAVRCSTFWISLRYCSYPSDVLRRLYVFNLLPSLWISENDPWWKISFNLWKAFNFEHKWPKIDRKSTKFTRNYRKNSES